MNTLYVTYKMGKPVACGSLLDCWKHIMNVYDNMMTAEDLAEAGIFIAPHSQAA